MKRFIAILFVVISCFMFCACKEIPKTRETTYSIEDIAVLNIFTFDGAGESKWGIKNLGHSFLSVENISDATISLAGKTIAPGEELYFGTWSLSLHFGVWFNVESNYIELYNKYNGRVSIAKGITEADLVTIGEFIFDNDKWNPIENCSNFAMKTWNKVAKEEEKLTIHFINTPSNLKKQLLHFKNVVKNKEVKTFSDCGYFADLTEDAFVFEGGEIYV